MIDKTDIPIKLDFEGVHYEGWATPSSQLNEQGMPKSYHVVLNKTLFGNVSIHESAWTVDEQRPQELVKLVGDYIAEWIE